MPLSRRYSPEHAPGDSLSYGIDLSFLIPPGVGIQSGSLAIYTNTAQPAPTSDFNIGPVTVRGRALYARLSGGMVGTDYQFRWTATDTAGNTWQRTALCLCSWTS
jgi:hypothetical protein